MVADAPRGAYREWSAGPVTPREWECLDGTLHVDEAGAPWIVYCHEWLQVIDGRMIAQRLSPDLRETIGEPLELFRASDAPWIHEPEPLWSEVGGHGMIARTLDGRLLVTLHQPNQAPLERPVFAEIVETHNSIHLT